MPLTMAEKKSVTRENGPALREGAEEAEGRDLRRAHGAHRLDHVSRLTASYAAELWRVLEINCLQVACTLVNYRAYV